MRMIYKYSAAVDLEMDLEMPASAEIVHVACQEGRGDTVQFWALVPAEDKARLQARRFYLRETGASAPSNAPHLATVLAADGELVWHIFDGGLL